jgi:DNA-binding transcriptional LysR family regulator
MSGSLPNLRHLHVLSEVARLGSVNAAARAVHLSQPAVTKAVAALERTLGIRLFERTARGAIPTEPGRILVARVDRALAQMRSGLEEALRGARPPGTDPLRAITVAQLDSLLAVVEQGSFGRAARAKHVATSTLHRAVRQLEAIVGGPLFESTSYGVRPTREAERLARRVQLAAAELAQARAEIAALEGADRGLTVIGTMPLARSLIVPTAVLEFARRNPRHAVSILDGPYESMLDALRSGRADVLIGALRPAPPDDVVQEHLFDDPLAIIVRADHPLVAATDGGRRAPTPAALARHAWVAPRRGSPLRDQYEALLEAVRAEPAQVAVECNSLMAARAILLASERVMLLSAQQVSLELQSGQLVALPHPVGAVVRDIGLTLRRDWRPTKAQQSLVDEIRQVARRLDVRPAGGARSRRKPGTRAATAPSVA